jgi:hypothetical protein
MGMFDKYDNLNPEYVPDNTTPKRLEEYLSINKVLPRPLRDVRGNIIGYGWNSGEYFNLNISVDNLIVINNDSIVYDEGNEKPTQYTVGEYKGQKCYNTVDAKSWTYVGRTDSLYVWVEDNELTYPIDGDRSIIIHRDMTNKYILVNIYNFRWEEVYSKQSNIGESSISIVVDEEFSKLTPSGIYYCTVKICGQDDSLIKDKFMISIT